MIPFCDAITVSLPPDAWPALRAAVLPELDAIGLAVEVDRDRLSLWRAPDGVGLVRSELRGGVRTLYASGAVCAGLRLAGRWSAYLGALGSVPHRVTRLDATLDRRIDAPEVLAAVASLARSGGVSFTRKSVQPGDVTTLLSQRRDGLLSGTCYVGSRRASVRLCLYDKRKERMDSGLQDVGPLTRYELRLTGGVGVTLRDAHDPAAVFWHFVPPEVLQKPPEAPLWAPAAVGWVMEPVAPLSPAERLHRRIQDSSELLALVRLASEFPGGLDYLCSQARQLARRLADGGGGVSPPVAAVVEPEVA